jgi:Right handed beta helix region
VSNEGGMQRMPRIPVRRGLAGILFIVLVAIAAILGVHAPASTPIRPPSPMPTVTPEPVTGGIAVPASIDATGATDASAALMSFVNSVPDGSTIVFKAGVYRMDQGLGFSDRHNLVFEGNGATLRSNGAGTCGRSCSLFLLRGGDKGITIRDFTLEGNSPTPGVYDPTLEHASAITIVGGGQVEIAHVTITGVGGDGLTLTGDTPDWPEGIWFHDSTCASSGRNGVAVVAGRNITVERVTFDESGYSTFDIEPNVDDQGASNVQFLDNTAGTWTNSFLSADGAAGSVVRDVTVSGNTVTGASLLTVIDLARRQNITFTNNRSSVTAAGPVLRFAHIDGLTVTGNIQPLSSGVLASITDSTGVTYVP